MSSQAFPQFTFDTIHDKYKKICIDHSIDHSIVNIKSLRLIYSFIDSNHHLVDISILKKKAIKHGVIPGPVGDGNGKTAVPSTYRPIGETCPDTCEFLNNGCLAQNFRVNSIQLRASSYYLSQAFSVAIACISAINRGELRKAAGIRVISSRGRINVSGDLLNKGTNDERFILCMIFIGIFIRGLFNVRVAGFGYTHVPRAGIENYIKALNTAGMIFRYSGEVSNEGAITLSFAHLKDLRKKLKKDKIRVVPCPEQLYPDKNIHCHSCGLCYEGWDTIKRLIVFNPHGPKGRDKKAKTASINKFGSLITKLKEVCTREV